MPSSPWYNTNANRAYPFLAHSVGADSGPLTVGRLSYGAIVDAGFVAGVRSRFSGHSVYLARIRREGNWFYFEFECDAPELVGTPLVFSRNINDPDFTVEFVDSGTSGLSDSSQSYSSDACETALWSGFLVTGAMSELDAFLSLDGVVSRSDAEAIIEPGLVQNLAGAYVSRIVLANDDRTRASFEDCDGPDFPFVVGLTRVASSCIVGDIRILAGYNTTTRQNPADNSITLGAAIGAGAGQPCEEIPTFNGEIAPNGYSTLSGSLTCGEVLRTVNGVAGPRVAFIAGRGVTITPEPSSNRITVAFDMSGLDLCEASAVSEPV